MLLTRTCNALMLPIALALALGATACEEPKKGPAERLGEKIDHAAGEVKEEAREAKKDIKKAADDAEDKLDD